MGATIHSEHVRVIRCDIKLGLDERSKDVESEMISEKIVKVYP
jgi:hypothetical protein